MNREEWLAGRHTGIGASEAAAVLGLSRYKSPLEVYLEKIGELGPQDDSERMYWGRKLEAIIAQEYGIRTGLKVNLNEDYTVLVHRNLTAPKRREYDLPILRKRTEHRRYLSQPGVSGDADSPQI